MVKAQETLAMTRQLADFYTRLTFDDLPAEVVDRARYFCLDFLGVAAQGSTVPSSRAIQAAVSRMGCPGESVVIGTDVTTVPQYAALANGAAAHCLELDDVNNQASLHPGAVMFPAALASANLARVDGRAFVTAVVVGYDLMIRLGYALDPHGTLERGFHPTGVCGIFGAVVTAARLLGLDTQATTWALGIAGSQTAGSMEYLAQGSWTKRMHPGWAAHSGILAALLAREGFTGPSTIFEGRDGFFHGYSSASEPPRALEELGELFFITRCTIKPYASCRYTHGPIDCLLRLKREHGIRPQEIAQVTVPVLKAGWNIVVAPEERKRDPQSIVDAQFSMPFGAAVALLYSHAFLEEYSEERLSSPEVREMMDKVRCVQDPALEEHFPARWPAWAEIETRDGRRFSTRTDYPKGDPENPLTWDELKGKFCALAGLVFSPKRQEEVIVRVEELEGLRDVRELASLVRTR